MNSLRREDGSPLVLICNWPFHNHRSPKVMLPILVILLSCLLAPPATRAVATNDVEYLGKMIACDERAERYVAQAYDAFLALSTGRELKPGELRFPARLVERSGDFVVVERAFYVSPNELRGFELLVPKALVSEKDGLVVSTAALSVSQRVTRQGITSFTLQKKSANKPMQPTPR